MRCCALYAMFRLVLGLLGSSAFAEQSYPLAPPDTSSPRATLKTFLDNANKAVEVYKNDHRAQVEADSARASRCLNLEQEPPALREAVAFYAVLSQLRHFQCKGDQRKRASFDHRIRIPVSVAYGSDLKDIQRILLDVAQHNELVMPDPAPRMQLRRFGDSALELELLCWMNRRWCNAR